MTTTTKLPELGAQIRAALEQLPPDSDVIVRVRHGDGAALEAAVLRASPGPGGAPTWQCDLPAALGGRMGLIDQALDRAGVPYPVTDLGLRARWRRVTSDAGDVVGFELALARGAQHAPKPAASRAGRTSPERTQTMTRPRPTWTRT
jgi:hypothetical protein